MFELDAMFNNYQYKLDLNERFVYRKELEDVLKIIKTNNNYKILILGSAGSGKTTLLHMICNCSEVKERLNYISAYQFHYNDSLLSQCSRDDVLLLDGLDEMKKPLVTLQEKGIQKYEKLICTSRFDVLEKDFFTHTIVLNPLTQAQIFDFITKFNLDYSSFSGLINKMAEKNVTPRDLLSMILLNVDESNIDEFYGKYKNLLYQFGNGVDFSPGIIVPKKQLIVPPKEIVKGLTIVNESLLKQAQKRPEIIYGFSSREFELMVCELLDKQGYNVKLTKQTRDGGKDIIIVENSLIGEFCTYVECKKYARNNPIRVQLVRELYGTVEAEQATAGMLITTSYFTKDAKEFTQKVKHRMALRDFNDLVKQLKQI